MANSQLAQQLQQELQNELSTSNQLLRLISLEIQQIKQFTSAGGEFDENIKKNASLTAAIANMQQINIENLPPMSHLHIDLSNETSGNQSNDHRHHDTFREGSTMDASQ